MLKSLFSGICLVLLYHSTIAQEVVWESVQIPPNVYMRTMHEHSSGILIGHAYADPASFGLSSGIAHTLYRSESPFKHWVAYKIQAWIDDIVETDDGKLFTNVWHNPDLDDILTSTDTGRTWHKAYSMQSVRLSTHGNMVIAVGALDSLAFSIDGGGSWEKLRSGLGDAGGGFVPHLDGQDRLYLTGRDLLLRSNNWRQEPMSFDTLYSRRWDVGQIFEFPDGRLCLPLSDGIYTTSDDGRSWFVYATYPSIPGHTFDERLARLSSEGDFYIISRTPSGWGNYNKYRLMRLNYGSTEWDTLRWVSDRNSVGRLSVGKDLYLSLGGKTLHSNDKGDSWMNITGDAALYPYFDIRRLGNGELLLNGRLGMLCSSGNGSLWSHKDFFAEKICLGPEGEIYAMTSDTLIVSNDHGSTYKGVDVSPPYPYYSDFTCLENGDIYVGGIYLTGNSPGSVVVSHDKGSTWSSFRDTSLFYLFSSPDSRIYFIDHSFHRQRRGSNEYDSIPINFYGSPSYPPSFYRSVITYSGAFLGSLWGGDLFRVDSGSIVADTIPYNPTNLGLYHYVTSFCANEDNIVYSGDQYGVYRTFDLGDTWQRYDSGIVTKYIYDLYYDESDHRVYCSTPDGVYRTIDPVVVDISTMVIPDQAVLAQNYPNPFSTRTTVTYTLTTRQQIVLEVYDALGRLVQTLHSGLQEAGTYEIQWNSTSLASGTYLIQLRGEHTFFSRIAVIR